MTRNVLSKVLYHTNLNPYHTDTFTTHGVYHKEFSKKVKNRVITQPINIKMKIVQKLKKKFCVIKTFKKIISVCYDHLKKDNLNDNPNIYNPKDS